MATNKHPPPDPVRILAVRVPDSVRRALVTSAAADGRTLSAYARRVLTAACAPAPVPAPAGSWPLPQRAPMRTRKAKPKKGGRRG